MGEDGNKVLAYMLTLKNEMKNSERKAKFVKAHKLSPLISRLVLGSIFIYSGIYKVTNPQIFLRAVENLGIFSDSLENIVVYAFPWIELVLGSLLITGLLARKAALGSAILLIFFISITVINSFKGNLVPCGCFPESSILSSNNPFIATIRNFILLILGGIIIVARGGL